MALSRCDGEYRETNRVQTEATWNYIMISCALSDSRVLIGERYSDYMELFQVVSSSHIERFPRITIPEEYTQFSAATSNSDTLVAMSFFSINEVRVQRLRCLRLEELSRIRIQSPDFLQWYSNRLIVSEWHSDANSHAVVELEMSGTQIEHSRLLIDPKEQLRVYMWCGADSTLAIIEDGSNDILHLKF